MLNVSIFFHICKHGVTQGLFYEVVDGSLWQLYTQTTCWIFQLSEDIFAEPGKVGLGLFLKKLPRKQNDNSESQERPQTVHWCQEDFEAVTVSRFIRCSTLPSFVPAYV